MARSPGGPGSQISWEEIWERLTGKSREVEGKPARKWPLIWIGVGAVIVIWLLTGIYTVGPGEQGVVRRFGNHVSTTDPGLHYHIPWPVERVTRVDIEEIRSAQVGFRRISDDEKKDNAPESQMLTGDENIVKAWLEVQYRVKGPEDFVFNVRDPEDVIHSATEVVLRGVVGQMEIDGVLTEGRAEIELRTKQELQALLDSYKSGLEVTMVNLDKTFAPDDVRDSFDEVVRAREDRNRLIREAEGYAADKVPKARGEGEKILLEAQAYRDRRVLEAEGDVARFLNILSAIDDEESLILTGERLYLETMERILAGVEKIVIDPDAGDGLVPFLPLKELTGPAPMAEVVP